MARLDNEYIEVKIFYCRGFLGFTRLRGVPLAVSFASRKTD